MRGEDHHARILLDLDDAYHGAVRQFTLRVPRIDAQGRVTVDNRTLSVKIPKGIRESQIIRLAGQGSPGMGEGKAGDLLLEVQFRPHARFRVDGRDLRVELPVAPWEAALGARIKAPTPEGIVDLTIPAGSTAGRKLRLKGRGIPGKPEGDLYVVLQIALPPADSESARQLYHTMQQEMAFNPRSGLGV